MKVETATIWNSDGTKVVGLPKDGKKFSLQELQSLVGGNIELVPGTGRKGKHTFCNEDGLRLNLPYNPSASMEFGINLVGDVVQVKEVEKAGLVVLTIEDMFNNEYGGFVSFSISVGGLPAVASGRGDSKAGVLTLPSAEFTLLAKSGLIIDPRLTDK